MSALVPYLPLGGIVAFFAVGFVWRAWLQYRRHGHSGIVVFRSADPRQMAREVTFFVVLVTETVLAVAAAAGRLEVDARTLPLAVGAALLFGGTLFMVAAQLHLGKSWRIGIEHGAAPGLVTGGLYRVCRNPIFLGLFVILAGLAVLLPSVVSLACFVLAVVCVRSQVLEEEAYLLRTYGTDYRAFTGRVGRFVPCLGLVR